MDDDTVMKQVDDARVPVYEIHADRRSELDDRINKANRRLTRAGATEYFTYTAEPFVHEKTTDTGLTVHIPMLRIALSAPKITAPGYTFIAALTQEEGGMIVRTAPGQSLDGWTRPAGHDCQYCKKSRHRSTSYVVRNDTTGEITQIGKSCLTPFLGVTPSGLWTLTLGADELLPAGDDDTYFGGRVPTLYPIRQLLAMAWAVSDGGKKFITAGQARDWEKLSTAQQALYVLNWRPIGSHAEEQRPYINAMCAAAAAVPDHVIDELLAAANTLDITTDYGANMAAALSGENVTSRTVGLVVSLIAVRNRILGAQAEAQANARVPVVDEWLGQPKDKLTNLDVTVQTVLYVDGYAYNSTDTIVVMRADSGHILKWKASGAHSEIERGETYHLDRATVKEHSEYRGVKQTVVTRCKLTPIANAA